MSVRSSQNSQQDRHYRAPSSHGQFLAVPALDVVVEQARINSSRLSGTDSNDLVANMGRVSLPELRVQARREIISLAVAWTNRITGQEVACTECSHQADLLYVTGHQPQLAHAGVWAKNFAAAGLAVRSDGLGLNIIVDNDTVGSLAVKVPTGSRECPSIKQVSFDSAQPQQPWEELTIHDRELFESFGSRVSGLMADWGIAPVVEEMWDSAIEASRRTNSMVEVLAACRILQERRWGITNLELPLSEICQSESFLIFVRHLLLHAEQFHHSYNRIVDAYRKENKIRNDRHPVPNLEGQGDAVELPFWFWREGDVSRGQVFVKTIGDTLQLQCREEVLFTATADSLLQELQALQQRGKLRTRALTTTLFARLCLADMFIHGIGGAKYDEMADLLITEFFGIVPPHFLVLTATLHLPIPAFDVSTLEVQQLRRRYRDFNYNAERYLSSSRVETLQARKMELIRAHWAAQTSGIPKQKRLQHRLQNRRRHQELKQVNRELLQLALPEMEATRQAIAQAEAQLKANTILKSREFSAVLFPEESIRSLAEQLSQPDTACCASR